MNKYTIKHKTSKKFKKVKLYDMSYGQARRLGYKKSTWLRSTKWHNTYRNNIIKKKQVIKTYVKQNELNIDDLIIVKFSYQATYRSRKNRIDINSKTITVIIQKKLYDRIIEELKEKIRSKSLEDLNINLVASLNEDSYIEPRGFEEYDIKTLRNVDPRLYNEIFNSIKQYGYYILDNDINVSYTNKEKQTYVYKKNLYKYL